MLIREDRTHTSFIMSLTTYMYKVKFNKESITYLGEKSSVATLDETYSWNDEREVFSSSLHRRFLRDFGKVEVCCLFEILRRFGMCPYGLVWWGRFLSNRTTSFGFSFTLDTSFFSCQPTYNHKKYSIWRNLAFHFN